jgi:cytochrome P450
MYPPIWLIGRTAKEDVRIADIAIKKGDVCAVSPYIVHRDERFFPDPERFDPDRWEPTLREGRPKFSYFPFGGGTRVCLGERFAWAEMILALATIAQKWRLRMAPGAAVKPVARITLQPSGPMRMIPERR